MVRHPLLCLATCFCLASSCLSQVKMPFNLPPGSTTPVEADSLLRAVGMPPSIDSIKIEYDSVADIRYEPRDDFVFASVLIKHISVGIDYNKVWCVDLEGGYTRDTSELIQRFKDISTFLTSLYRKAPSLFIRPDLNFSGYLPYGGYCGFRGEDCVTVVSWNRSDNGAFAVIFHCVDVAIMRRMMKRQAEMEKAPKDSYRERK